MKRNSLVQYLSHFKTGRGIQNCIRIDRFLVMMFWLHLPAGLLVNLAYGRETWFHVAWEGVFIPLVPTVALLILPPGGFWIRQVNAMIAMILSGWLIHLSGGTIEFHFHVFVCLAVLSYYRDWRILIPAAVFIMLHHLVLNYVSPYDVFTYGPRLSSVFIHALFVALETSYLIFDITESERREAILRQATKTDAIGQLTGGIAHDFNNLLTVIAGNTQLIQEEGNHSPETNQAVSMISHAVGRATELTRRLLAFGRQQALSPRLLDLNDCVASMEKMLRRTLGEHIAVHVQLAENLWPTFADRTQLESALLNLAVNARDAMPNGGQLTIETGNVRQDDEDSEVDGLDRGSYVMLTVRDTGMGMRPDVIERAFDPFFTTKEVGKGTGLGLSMVYGFVKQSGGHAAIQSQVGKGTAVALYLPRLEAGAAPDLEDQQGPEVPMTGSETVLVVEDDEFVRAHAVKLLTKLGYGVIQAENGAAALAAAQTAGNVHLLFTDVVMPGGMNGRQLADELARQRPGLRVLYTSGYPSTVLSHDGHLDSGIHLLPKPYHQADLARKIRDVLDSGGSASGQRPS